MNPDVVYVVRPGERNEELRYSLRSLQNLPHGRVWIAGHCPKWVQGVDVIPVPRQKSSHASVKANLRSACEHPEVSEEFYYFNDDFYVMQPVDRLPVMHRGPLVDVIDSGIMATAYSQALRKTLILLRERGIDAPLMYDLHAPMLVTKAGMLETLDLCHDLLMHERTLYGNLQGIGGERHRNYKVKRADRGFEGWPFLSTMETTFPTHPAGAYVRSRFGTPSPHEREVPAIPAMVPPTVRTPVRYRAVGTRVRAVA